MLAAVNSALYLSALALAPVLSDLVALILAIQLSGRGISTHFDHQ